jgi:hypothetical protein
VELIRSLHEPVDPKNQSFKKEQTERNFLKDPANHSLNVLPGREEKEAKLKDSKQVLATISSFTDKNLMRKLCKTVQ